MDEKTTIIYIIDNKDIILTTEETKEFIKSYIVKLKELYDIELIGLFKINIYINEKIKIIEFNLIEEYKERIDLNVTMYTEPEIYIKYKDYYLIKKNKIFYKDYYYTDINEVEDIYKYIEFIDFIYEKDVKNVKQKGKRL